MTETSLNHSRNHFALANIGDRFIMAIGGSNDNNCLSSTERFDIENSYWEVLPPLSEARQGASACVHDGSVYVVCGLANDQVPLCSIEKLSEAFNPVGEIGQWERYDLTGTSLIPRWFPIVSALNQSEIAIMGGIGEVDGETGVLSDVILFNVDSISTHQTVKNYQGLLAF